MFNFNFVLFNMSDNIVSVDIQNVDTTVDKDSDDKTTIANDVNKSEISSEVEKCSTNETKDSSTEECYMQVDEYPPDAKFISKSAELTETEGPPLEPVKSKINSESVELTKGSSSDQEMPDINSESAELTKGSPSDPKSNSESVEPTKEFPPDPEPNSESAELAKGSSSDTETNSEPAELTKVVAEYQPDLYINPESAEQSDCDQDISIDSASGGSGSEKELRALRSNTCPKTKQVVKLKTKSKITVKPTKGKKLTKKTNYQQSDSGSDTDPDIESKKEKPTASSKKKKMGNFFSTKCFKPTLYKRWSDRDTEEYRNGYPGKKDDLSYKANEEFYMNQIVSYPEGDKIDVIHEKWWGKHRLLETHHGYIQWLFPIREHGMNMHAQELQLHEAKVINADSKAHARILKSYEMMLEFYGVKLVDTKSGQLTRGDNWQDRFQNLNTSMHNYLRITRILKSLGEFNYEHLKEPFVRYMITEALKEKTLKNTASSCMNYWVGTIKDDRQRQKLREYAIELGYKDF